MHYQDRSFLFSPRACSRQTPLPHHGKLPAVAHFNFFCNAYKMTSRQCVSTRQILQRNTCLLLLRPRGKACKIKYASGCKGLWLIYGEWRGLTVSVEDCHSKGRGFASTSRRHFFENVPKKSREKIRAGSWTSVRGTTSTSGRWEARTTAREACKSGTATRIGSVRLEKRLNGQRRARNDMERKIN